ncbi:MAG TPA: oxidoreductase [Candidatus Limnocylindria bacterium]|nr:oxidoreductase [Candidatus Limnocylindria bacterium]
MLSRAQAMRLTLRERQARCEDLGRLPQETNQDFADAGFYRILQPRCFGGYEFSLTEFVSLLVEITRGCLDSGWVLSQIASGPVALGRFPAPTQWEAYGRHGDFRAAMVIRPGGFTIPTPEGYGVQAAWDYCSGCDVATHVLGNVLVRDTITKKPTGIACVLVDREQYEIVRNWDMMGMQGTGSHRVVMGERTIPAHRVQLMTGDLWEPENTSGRPILAASLVGGFAAYAVAVGAARGALDIYDGLLRSKKWIAPPFPACFELPDLQHSFGEAQALVDTAEAALTALALRYTSGGRTWHAEGVPLTAEDLRRIHRAGLQCLEYAWQAVDIMLRTSGSSSATRQAPLGRYFRGLAVLRTHLGLQYDHVSINVARLHFGLPALSPL